MEKNPEKSIRHAENGPAASNLKKGGLCFYRVPASVSRDQFFLNRVIPLWNESPQKVTEAKTSLKLNSTKRNFSKSKKKIFTRMF